MFNLAIDSKLRASDLVRLKITDVCSDQSVRDRGTIIQKKTGRPVHFEITRETRLALEACLAAGTRDGVFVSLAARTTSSTYRHDNMTAW